MLSVKFGLSKFRIFITKNWIVSTLAILLLVAAFSCHGSNIVLLSLQFFILIVVGTHATLYAAHHPLHSPSAPPLAQLASCGSSASSTVQPPSAPDEEIDGSSVIRVSRLPIQS